MIKLIYIIITICLVSVNYLSAQNDVELLGQLNPYPNLDYADIWGYAANGREYALMGVTGGTSIIDVTDPAKPVEVDFITGPTAPPYEWRDIKTHLNYAYVVTMGTGSGQGLQIIDLSNLPTSASLVNTVDTLFSRAHDIFIDNGYAYVVGTNGGGGMHILDLSDPVNPTETAYYTASGYIHDLYVWDDTVVVCAGSSGEYHLVNVSNKSNPQFISASSPISGIYAHSGWMTEDKRYFIAAEEFNVRDLIVYDLQDRSTWDVVVPSWQMSGNSPIHNIFVLGNYAHISYYKDGYVVLDISDPTAPKFAGQYDTFPGSGGTYDGAWGCYPYLPSGHVIISDISTGLYVLKFDMPTAVV
ncbi:MAG: choice-of-anchor B family protein, partial [Bacteroidetes bacterium]|nr:choice-of-anchor B family protein [Bacteroidota bacterium]